MPEQLLHWGPGALSELGGALDDLGVARGVTVLIVTSPSRRFLDAAVAALGGRPHAVFDEAVVHVPAAVVERAREALSRSGAAAVVALGGGSAIGLGKALRLQAELAFVAVPTTFSGSERTSIWGISRGGEKHTGRDERARPDVVVYDLELLSGLPARVAIPSALNALAHPVSALSTGRLDEAARAGALGAVELLLPALSRLSRAPDDAVALERIARGAAAAGEVIERGAFGGQHAAAHLLGGRFGLEHSALHAVLLPRFYARLEAPLRAEIAATAGVPDPAGEMLEALQRVGAPRALGELGVNAEQVEQALAGHPELAGDAGDFVRDALA